MLNEPKRRGLSGSERRRVRKQTGAFGLHKPSLWRRVKRAFMRFWWWWQGNLLNIELEKDTSRVRTEAQIALDRVVFETHLPHDCITACIVRGGPCILVKHDAAQEAFIGTSYNHAADKAIEWINAQGDEISTEKTTKLSRKAQKVFDAQRRRLTAAVRDEKRKKSGLN